MMRSCWRKQLAALATAVVLVGGAVQAQATGDGPAVIVLREAGQPERRCKIEQSTPQPDGSIIHVVRDLATGEQYRVKDTRKRKTELAQVVARIRGTESSSLTIMPMPPATNNSSAQRVPTTAELAGARFATELASGRPGRCSTRYRSRFTICMPRSARRSGKWRPKRSPRAARTPPRK